MRGTLVFVHGTGVRKEGWVETFARVQDYARINGIEGVKFVGCPWGLELGVPVEHIEETLPPEVVTREALGIAQPSGPELEAASWSLLLEDPLFELRLVGEGGGPAGQEDVPVVGDQRADQAAVAMLQELRARAVSLDLSGIGIPADEIADAADAVADAPELLAAAQAAGKAADPDFIAAVARAVVARVLAAHRFDPPGTAPAVLFDDAKRGRLVQQVDKALAPAGTRGLLNDWIKKKAGGFAVQRASSWVESRRNGFMGLSTPAIGDILFYQRRGEAFRDFVASRLRGLDRPVVAVGHSLGGIVLVDLLSRPGAPPVDLLVTAGSQSPMLYAIDALDSIRWGKAQPVPFTPWLNIYNRQDFLSFIAGRIFQGVSGITDEEVDPGVPFPESHSAYWYSNRVYELIRQHWPAVP
jgi:hypothetical protein